MSEEEREAFSAKVEASIAKRKAPARSVSARKRQEPTTTDPLSPDIDRWLRSIEPRLELVLRYAMRTRWPEVRASRSFTARIEEVEEDTGIRKDPDRLVWMLKDARAVGEQIEELIEGKPRR